MKKIFFLFLMVNVCVQLLAQTNKADSLTGLLNRKEDTSKVNVLNELTKALWYYQLNKAAEYNFTALKLADSLSYKKGLAEANRCRGVILSFRGDSSGMLYLVKALDMFRQLNYKRGIAATLNNQNEFYFRRKQYSKALDVLFQSLDLFTELQDKEAIGAVINQIGNVYNFQSNFSAALEYYLKALSIRREINDKPGTAFTLNRVGDMYSKLGQLPEALGYYRQSLQMAQEIGRKQNIIDAAISIGSVYQRQEKYKEALEYFNISLKAEDDFFGKDSMSRSYMYIGQVYQAQKNYPLSLFNFQKALAITEKKNEVATAGILQSIGRVSFDQGDFRKAITSCMRSLDLAKQNNVQDNIKDASLTLSEIYASVKDYDKAYHYHVQYAKAKDSILDQDLNQKLAAVQQSFETKNRQAQIDLLNRDKQLQQSKLDREKQQRYAFIFGIIVFIGIAIVLAGNNRQKQKANRVLEKTLSDLKSAQSQLIQSEKMASLGQLTAGIAHEIQNPLNFVNNFSELSSEMINEMVDANEKGNTEEAKAIASDVQQNLEKIVYHGKRADSIVKGMLQHSRASTGNKELTAVNSLADEYLRLAYQGLRAKDKAFNVVMKTNFDNSIGKINIIPQDIGRVLLNLYNNAFYAVNERKKSLPPGEQLGSLTAYEPTVTVATKKIGDKPDGYGVEIRITDNGGGIPQSLVDKIFQPFFTTKPAGQGTGLGLSLSYDIIKAHGGEIKVETKEGEGTEFIIQIPSTK
ncbi:MAG: tetratricopeptide repeat protein [Chitinophagaceae bacterium]